MRQTIGGTWLLQLVVLFILLFVGYIVLTLNYSKTVKIKNEMISMIEEYEGLNDNSLKLVDNYLTSLKYDVTGVCTKEDKDGVYGAENLTSFQLEKAEPNKKYYYCIRKYKGTKTSTYYQISLFYKFNLPIIGETGRFAVKGVTNNFQAHDNGSYAQAVGGSFTGSGSGTPITPPSPSPNPGETNTYTVTFNLNGAPGSIPSQTVVAGGTATRPTPAPTRTGYTFKNWILGDHPYNFNNTPVNSDIELVAAWEVAEESIPTLKEYILSRANDRWSGLYDCISNSTFCVITTLGNMKWAACSNYMHDYPNVYSNEDVCKNEVESIYSSLPHTVNK